MVVNGLALFAKEFFFNWLNGLKLYLDKFMLLLFCKLIYYTWFASESPNIHKIAL